MDKQDYKDRMKEDESNDQENHLNIADKVSDFLIECPSDDFSEWMCDELDEIVNETHRIMFKDKFMGLDSSDKKEAIESMLLRLIRLKVEHVERWYTLESTPAYSLYKAMLSARNEG